ncbi:MAG: hypothetical protein KC621_34120, partial [Myxococcales bacterium]|nr:hypothetical protein [Myxococcales bacterium]
LVEAWEGPLRHTPPPSAVAPPAEEPVVVVRMAVRLGELDTEGFVRAVVRGDPMPGRRENVSLELAGLRFPPRDLGQTLPQQLLVLDAAREAMADLELPRDRTSILVGMGTDPTVARYGLRWLVPELGVDDAGWQREAMDAVIPHLTSAGVLGTMPNIPTNRLNTQFDLAGPSFSVFGEEASGLQAFGLARRALRSRQLDAAVVGAVDLSVDPVHQAAVELPPGAEPADAAVVMVLLRESDARARRLPILARLDEERGGEPLGTALEDALGHPHAAVGWLRVAAAIARLGTRGGQVAVRTSVLGAGVSTVRVSAGEDPIPAPSSAGTRSLSWPAHLPDVALPPPPAPLAPSPVETFRTRHANLVSGHLEHLAQLTALHARFLHTHQHEVSLFAGGATPALAPPPAPAPRPEPTMRPTPPALRIAFNTFPFPEQVPVPDAADLPGPTFDRLDLEVHGSGRISRLFGEGFAPQDAWAWNCRMPEPPLLLADRALGIDAPALAL